MNRDVQSVLLALVGAATLKISWGDAYLSYVKEGMRPFLLVSGALLLALGVVSAWRDRDEAAHPSGEGGQAVTACGPDHDATHTGPRVAWMLLLPVAALFLVAPPALGADAAARDSGTVADPGQVEFSPLAGPDPVELTVLDYAVRASWGGADTLAGRQVRMLGFVTPRPEGGWYLTRISLACCAADGQATKVHVLGASAPPTDTWVEVVGEYAAVDAADPRDVPAAVRAGSVTEVPPPRQPYL